MNSPEFDEQLEPDLYSNLPSRNDSSTGRRNRNSCRSKHSETEQRRRSKINERFQSLMDIIPQNDQKRDKASFLLEVIEYIHFLQEKVQMYEGSHQMWYQDPTKLIPWRNNHGSVVEVSDYLQGFKSFPSIDKVAASSGLVLDMQNSRDPVIDPSVSIKILEQSPISAVSSYIPTEPLLQFVQHDFWHPKPSAGSVNGIGNNTNELLNLDEKTSSTVCSQRVVNRVLHTLTETLKLSGVNMSETMISVQLSLWKRADAESSASAFPSEGNCNSIVDEEGDSPTETRSFYKELDHSQKRIRR